ncbi:MAG: DUF4870 domain-containing protein [Bacteroidota bacterium]|jgi:uncharacterized Tic20 family protein|nr:DUF4870 domain-containing protein [Ignavibacteria bacterium]MCU7498250.1 DUF4870 domain-containing protein [Ignavibacteria bacterium]MCU7511258.1 DUF4870 domain-containing protein [Ignavibacteria bacterium]MCU7523301.1 DUF4870 domain-containing protein [Ignavibacteria bacterium]
METVENAEHVGNEALDKDTKLWGMLCHLSALLMFVIPFGNIIGPLVVWMLKKDVSPFVNDQGKESLNFQISMTIYIFAAFVLMLVAIGIVLMVILGILELILIIVASVQANDGKAYRYPLTVRFIK